jgi:hypothetical protein
MLSELTTAGLIFWIIGWGGVITLVTFCIVKVMRTGSKIEKD